MQSRPRRLAFFAASVLACALARAEEPYPIPYDQLTADQARLVHEVVDHPNVATEFAQEEVRSSVPTYDYLLDRLPLTARMVRALDLGKYVIKPLEEDCVVLDDREGVKVSLYLLHKAAGLRIYYTKGFYQGPLLPKVSGRGVIVLKYGRDGDAIATGAKLFFHIDSGVVRAVSKVLHSAVTDVVKDKGTVFISAAKEISERVARDPEGLYHQLKESGRFTDSELSEYKEQILAESVTTAPGK